MASFGGYWDQFQPHQTQQPALPGGTAVAAPPLQPSEPIKVGPSAQPADPTNPNAQLAGSAAAGGGDYQAIFNQLFPGDTLSPEQLAASESKLPPGWRLLGPNAAGQRSKIELPNGQIIDAIGGAGSGQNRKQFMVTGGGGGGTGGGAMGNFQVGMFTGGGQYPLSSVMGEGLSAPWTVPFNAPDPNSVTNDKALQWQMGRGMEAIQRSAAAKGTLLTGGVLKQLDAFGQGLGSTYYNDVYNRKLGEYKMAHDIYGENQQNIYNRLFGVSQMGAGAANALGNYGNAYGTNATNLETGMGSARSAGTVGIGNAISNAVGGVVNAIGQSSYGQNKPAPTQQGPMSENPWDPMYSGGGA